jgi:hypothetical protein
MALVNRAAPAPGLAPCPPTRSPFPAGATVSEAMVTRPKLFGRAVTVDEVARAFRDDHVHVALIVARDRLLAVLERSDLTDAAPGGRPALPFGRLTGRTVRPDADLTATWELMRSLGRRRFAVVDGRNTLRGLLCLKRTGLGFCSDADVSARALERFREHEA